VVNIINRISTGIFLVFMALSVIMLTGCLASSGGPSVDGSETSHKLENLPRPKGERKVVTIYRFNGRAKGITGRSVTDMFTTALVKAGRFKVVERQRLANVMREKSLNRSGKSTGKASQYKLRGADYIFEGTISEVNNSKSRSRVSASYKGLGGGVGDNKGSIGLDIRVVDARDGTVLDAINVRKEINSSNSSVSGIGRFISNVTGKRVGGDIGFSNSDNEGVDEAIRACVEEAIYQIARRYQ